MTDKTRQQRTIPIGPVENRRLVKRECRRRWNNLSGMFEMTHPRQAILNEAFQILSVEGAMYEVND
jgi:hypothetical protein